METSFQQDLSKHRAAYLLARAKVEDEKVPLQLAAAGIVDSRVLEEKGFEGLRDDYRRMEEEIRQVRKCIDTSASFAMSLPGAPASFQSLGRSVPYAVQPAFNPKKTKIDPESVELLRETFRSLTSVIDEVEHGVLWGLKRRRRAVMEAFSVHRTLVEEDRAVDCFERQEWGGV